MVTFRAYEDILPQFRDGADIVTIGTFGPKTFRRLLFLCRAGQDAFFNAPEPTALTFFTLSFVTGEIRFKIVVVLHYWSLFRIVCHGNLTQIFHIPSFNGRNLAAK